MAILDSNLLQSDKISSNSLPKSILPPIPNIASTITVLLEISLSVFALIKSESCAALNACSHRGDFFTWPSTSINLTHFFNSLRPMPMKYPSPPLLPGPHRIKNSDVEKSLFNISTDCLAASIIARRSSPFLINKFFSKALTCSAV